MSTSSRLSELRQLTLNAGGPNSYQLTQRERITFALVARTESISAAGLRALILEDLGRFPDSGRAYIHRRIAPEIHEKALARPLDALLGEGAIVSTGERRWRKYRLASDKGHQP